MNVQTQAPAGMQSPGGRTEIMDQGLELDLAMVSSITLARLVEEVKNEELPGATKYDRTYNRHNR